MDVDWGTQKTRFLSKRMALRVLKRTKERPRVFNISDLIRIGFGMKTANRPSWTPLESDLKGYEDTWEDWTTVETEAIVVRLKEGLDSDLLQRIFMVPESVMAKAFDLAGQIPKQRSAVYGYSDAKIDEGEEPGYFTAIDFPIRLDRDYANERWLKYGERIDLTAPANETTVRSLVFSEILMRKLERDMQSTDPKLQSKATDQYSKVRSDFSKAAADVAILERQYEISPEHESFDAIIKRTREIRKDWRDMDHEYRMGEHNLIRLIADFHRTALEQGSHEFERMQSPGMMPVESERPEMPTDPMSKRIEHQKRVDADDRDMEKEGMAAYGMGF